MNSIKNRILKNFTWRRFLLYSFVYFFITLIVNIILNYFDADDAVSNLFTAKELVDRTGLSIIIGFVSAIFFKANNIEPSFEETPNEIKKRGLGYYAGFGSLIGIFISFLSIPLTLIISLAFRIFSNESVPIYKYLLSSVVFILIISIISSVVAFFSDRMKLKKN